MATARLSRMQAVSSQQPTYFAPFFLFCSPWNARSIFRFIRLSFSVPSSLSHTCDCFHYISSGIWFLYIFNFSIVCKFAHLLKTIFLFNDFCKTYTFLILHAFNGHFFLLFLLFLQSIHTFVRSEFWARCVQFRCSTAACRIRKIRREFDTLWDSGHIPHVK